MPALVLAVALAALARWRARNEDMSKVNLQLLRDEVL
jgi:hypothetical protein